MQQPLVESVSLDSRTKGCWWGRHRGYTKLVQLTALTKHAFHSNKKDQAALMECESRDEEEAVCWWSECPTLRTPHCKAKPL